VASFILLAPVSAILLLFAYFYIAASITGDLRLPLIVEHRPKKVEEHTSSMLAAYSIEELTEAIEARGTRFSDERYKRIGNGSYDC
jgi:hypothetical protein